jgi:hypothetical protein
MTLNGCDIVGLPAIMATAARRDNNWEPAYPLTMNVRSRRH